MLKILAEHRKSYEGELKSDHLSCIKVIGFNFLMDEESYFQLVTLIIVVQFFPALEFSLYE